MLTHIYIIYIICPYMMYRMLLRESLTMQIFTTNNDLLKENNALSFISMGGAHDQVPSPSNPPQVNTHKIRKEAKRSIINMYQTYSGMLF